MKMPFGKYKGKPLEELPRAYLIWLNNNTKLYGDLQIEVEMILGGETRENKSLEELIEKLNFDWEA
jgi:uncharacterized protein (DUF3820 family)